MNWKLYLLSVAPFVHFSQGLLPELEIEPELSNNEQNVSPLSLPNLLNIQKLTELHENWNILGEVRLDTGRLLIENTGGIWSIPYLEGTKDWTVELVFRSTGSGTSDLQFSATNGLSFWLINPDNSLPISSQNVDNFGGPSEYDGFQFLVNNQDINGLKIFNNDGSKRVDNKLEKSVGSCAFNFLDSLIPFTMRVSYSEPKKWFKVQIDNELCFKTDQIVFPNDISNFVLGITGSVDKSSKEIFEILRLEVWNHLTNDAIDDHGLMSEGQVHVTVASTPEEVVPSRIVRESLLERNRKHREEIQRQIQEDNNSLKDVHQKLDHLEIILETLEKSVSYDTKSIDSQIQELKLVQNEQRKIVSELGKNLENFEQTITQQYSQMLGAFSKLNEKVIGEVREQHYGMEELSRKVDLLMSNHREISDQYKHQNAHTIESREDMSNLINSVVKFFLIPVVIALIALTIFVYKVKHEIKHSKLL